MFVLGVVQVSMKYLANYSIFDPPTMDHITCPEYWWRNLLYINTLFPVEEMVSSKADFVTNDFLIISIFYSVCYGVGIWQMTRNFI